MVAPMNKPDTTPAQPLPLFAQLLERTEAQTASGSAPRPTYHCLDSECTKKYPSDGDDCYSGAW
jgi:hypothetical protein